MGDRFALYPPELFAKRPAGGYVWIHAVSVGEVQVAGRLMREWRKAEPSVAFFFTTTSSTGRATAVGELGPDDILAYNPLDFPTFVKAAFETVRPRAVVLAESEIWPNFIRQASRRGIPLFLANARVSDRSAPRYRFARFWFGDILRRFDRIFAQSPLDRDRLVAAGADPSRIEIAGSFKFDAARRNPEKERELADWIRSAVPGGGKVLLGGSTWPGEDAFLLRVHKKAVERDPSSLLVIAPRHFEKADAVEAQIVSAGFRCVRRSRPEPAPAAGAPGAPAPVLLADTTGELTGLYGLADAVFVGKSLCAHGSQNMIEPCLCGKPTVVGPYTENFRPVMSDLLAADAIVQAKDADEAERTLLRWLSEGDGGLGARAAAAVARRRGVVARCLAEILRCIREAPPRKPPAPRSSVWREVAKSAAVALAVLAILICCPIAGAHRGRLKAIAERRERIAARLKNAERPRFNVLRIVEAFVAMAEKPDAVRVFLADAEAAKHRVAFAAAGLKCTLCGREKSPDARYDIVLACGRRTAEELAALAAKVSRGGALAWSFSVEKMTAGGFKEALSAFPCADARLWMPGECDWMLSGKPSGAKTKMSAVLDFFSRRGASSPEAAEAGCSSVQGLFASYAGERTALEPAFAAGGLDVPARPEFFLSEETPDIGWIVPDDMDADVVESLASKIRALQDVRRDIVRAAVASRRQGGEEEALRIWAGAMERNPRDPMLLDRLYRLGVNARAFRDVGNAAYAAKCYDTMIAINPRDAGVLREYALCMKTLGRHALAAKALERAAELEKEPGAGKPATIKERKEG